MDRKKKYRLFLILFLCLDLLTAAVLTYRYLDRKIPDEIYVEKNSRQDVSKLLGRSFVSFDKALEVSGNGSYRMKSRILGMIPFKEVKVTPTEKKTVYASGSTVGIYMETEGVLIIDTGEILSDTGESQDPAGDVVEPGDYIVAFNDQTVSSKRELMNDLKQLKKDTVTLKIKRKGKTIPVSIKPARDSGGNYRLGIWVRDDTQGIGTLTFVDEKGRYGALGHGISDVDTGSLLDIKKGELYQAQILGIQKGSRGNPGELAGLIRYEPGNIIGNIGVNSENGIFGEYTGNGSKTISLTPAAVGYKQEMKTGKAQILCCVDRQVEAYDAEIEQIDMNYEDTNKSFVIHVTDESLLASTGGIVQGMSGSPVMQDGKIFGAVTHVFVSDPSRGYGIFIENMMGH